MSTTEPQKIEAYHYRLHTIPPLPKPYDSTFHWVKADMLYTVSFDRLTLLSMGKDASGKRLYDQRVVDRPDMLMIQSAVLHGLGMTALTGYL